jgi:hypothetical protein
MTRMDYQRRGGLPYGRNRELAMPNNGPGAERFFVIRSDDKHVAGIFDSYSEAVDERDRVSAASGRPHFVRKT